MEGDKAPPVMPRPLFIPHGVALDTLPDDLRIGMIEIVNPAYEQLVMGARTALERGQGLAYCELLFFEMLEAIELGNAWADNLVPRSGGGKPRPLRLRRLLDLIGLKDKIASFLLEVEKFYGRNPYDPLSRTQNRQ